MSCLPSLTIELPQETKPKVLVQPSSLQPIPTLDASGNQELLVKLYDLVNPGVVSIRVYTTGGDGGQGSGFVYDQQGNIVTNYHVIENVDEIEVAFPSGYRAKAEVVGTDPDSDIGVIRVNVPVSELHPLPLGSSAQVKVGQTVVAIGNPFGLSGTMTVGIVSALGRTLESMRTAPGGGTFSSGDLIQTDAAINPGNSGGPLLNLNGEVIGINRAIRTTSETTLGSPVNSGIGFAVPVDMVRKVIPELIRSGKYDYSFLGITSRDDMTLKEMEALDVANNMPGAYVAEITTGSPAAQAGLRGGSRATGYQELKAGGDWITAVDGQPIRRFNELLTYLMTYTDPGDTVTLTILRDEQELQIPVTLVKRPD